MPPRCKRRPGRPQRSPGEPTTTLGLRLTQAERARLEALAKLWGCSHPDAARRAIEQASEARWPSAVPVDQLANLERG
jgi:hypothetical protein